ncbi:hypothetical protein ACIRBX_29385 [Kitasatospora sp. NPDC096147]
MRAAERAPPFVLVPVVTIALAAWPDDELLTSALLLGALRTDRA